MNPENIAAGARTVEHLAEYFEEQKSRVAEMRGRFGSRRRGYFTPSEDEEVRQLLVSYCQCRAALLEIVQAFRDDAELTAGDRPAAFLVAFAAATLLVDAARFLRESFDQTPVVCDKLNEPEPHFGIPAGTYDAVQRSLTSTRHAWHLYHALAYFDANQEQLRRLGEQQVLAGSLEVINRLGHRLRVPAERFARASLRDHARQALRGVGQGLLYRALYGLQKLGASLMSHCSTRPGHRPAVPPQVREQLAAVLQPGDVLLTRKEYAVTNYFLPGYWPHAALYLGDAETLRRLGIREHPNVAPRWARLLAGGGAAPCAGAAEPRKVLEALKDGVHIRTLDSPLCADSLAVLRPRLSPADVGRALARGLFHEGKPYDFDFDFSRSDRLVCTEVVYRSYEGVGGLSFQLARRAGRLTLSAEDLLQMALAGQGFELAAVYAPPRSAALVTGNAAAAAVAAALARGASEDF